MLSSQQDTSGAGTYFSRFLDETGDGTGNKQATGDYAAVVTDFLIAPPATQVFDIHRMIVQIADTGNMDAGSYGNGITLTNGINLITLEEAAVVSDYMDGIPVLTNGNWARVCYDVNITDFGTGENYVGVRWTFTRGGRAIRLIGSVAQSLAIRLNDDFTNLNAHTFLVQGLAYE